MDRYAEEGGSPPDAGTPGRPYTDGGDRHWLDVYGACAGGDGAIGGYALDLRDVAVRALASIAPHMDLDQLRSGGRTRPLVKVRRQVIVRVLNAGYRPTQIARFLRISPTAVSLANALVNPMGRVHSRQSQN
jgi:hypothetical protein